jgi:hypothetical protein
MPALAPASARVAAPNPARLDSRGPTRARRACLARPRRARSSDDCGADTAVRVDVWAGGGTGVVAPSDASALKRLETRWLACAAMDLESRWGVAKDLWLLERDRAGLSAEWKLGWSGAKTYVGITYMWGEEGQEKGEIFLSKYLLLDPTFENVLGCLRHELAHALVGPTEDHGPRWRDAAVALRTPRNWAGDTAIGFYARPNAVALWTALDVASFFGRAFELPPELFEKTVWPGDGTRTVFTDEDGNVVM